MHSTVRGNRGSWVRRLIWKGLHHLPEMELRLATRHGPLRVSNKDRGVGRILFLHRQYEQATIQKAVCLLDQLYASRRSDRRLMLDVGANVGTVCISMVRGGVFSGALAIEPEPRNYRLLVRNVADNGLASAIGCYNVALSSTEGVGEMELSRNSGDHRLRVGVPIDPRPRYNEHRRRTISVPVRRLDDIVAEAGVRIPDLGLLWMDTQGSEKHILEGAARLVQAGVPVVTEFWPYGLARTGVSAKAYSAYITEHFAGFYDLADEHPVLKPSGSVEQLFERYSDSKRFTDILLVHERG